MSVTKMPDGTYQIEIDIWGDEINDLTCLFQPLITQARIYSALKSFFKKSLMEAPTLANLKGIEIEDAIEQLRLARQLNIQKSAAYAHKLFDSQLEQTLSNAVRDLAYQVIEQTINDLKEEISVSPALEIEERLKTVKSILKRRDRVKLNLPKLGRRPGSKKQNTKYSERELYSRLKKHLQYWDFNGDKITQGKAAKALGLGYAKALQRLLVSFGEKRNWRELVEALLAEAK